MTPQISLPIRIYESSYHSNLGVYVYKVPWSEFPIVSTDPHYPHRGCACAGAPGEVMRTLHGYLAHKKPQPPLGPP